MPLSTAPARSRPWWPRWFAACLLGALAGPATAALVAHYRMEQTAWNGTPGEVVDSSGNARHGVRVGTANTIAEGKVCRGGEIPQNLSDAFDAVDTGVRVATGSFITGSGLTATGTISFWYRGRGAWEGGMQDGQLFDASTTSNAAFLLTRRSNGSLRFHVTDTTGQTRDVSTPNLPIAAGTWVHVAVSWQVKPGNNQTRLSIRVDGVVQGAAIYTMDGPVHPSLATLYVGDSRANSTAPGWTRNSADGRFDELRIHDHLQSDAEVRADMAATNPCLANLHHLEIRHGSGSGVTCTPSTLTVVACQDGACAGRYTGGLAGSLSVAGAGMTVNWPAGSAFAIPAGASSVEVPVQVTTPGSVVFAIASSSPPPSSAASCDFGTPSCSFVAADSGLLFDLPDHVAATAQALSLRAVRKSDSSSACVPAFANVSKAVTFRCAYVDPGSGTLPLRVGGRALNAANSAAGACDAAGQPVTLAFDAGGQASTTLDYADAGRLRLDAVYSGSPGGAEAGLVMTGSDGFVVAPQRFALSALGSPPYVAGVPFASTVAALSAAGLPTPNFGRENVAQSPALSWVRVEPTGPGASDGFFTGTLTPFSGGVASSSDLVWSEVGRGRLVATLAGYLGSALGISGTTDPASPLPAFRPHHFDVAATPACGAFTYAGQPFAATITARSGLAPPTTTLNYDGSAQTVPNFARSVTLSDAGALGLGGFGASANVAAGSFGAGIAAASPAYAFTDKLTAPQMLRVRATDADGVSSAGFAEGGTPLRSGRARLFNAFGSEKAALSLALQIQYWSGQAWLLNAADGCSSIAAAAVARSGQLDSKGAPTAAWSTTPSAIAVAGGLGTLSLSAPAPAGTGSIDIALNLGGGSADQSCLAVHPATTGAALPWLRSRNGNCSAAWDRDPSARASFGIASPETKRTIHVREIF